MIHKLLMPLATKSGKPETYLCLCGRAYDVTEHGDPDHFSKGRPRVSYRFLPDFVPAPAWDWVSLPPLPYPVSLLSRENP